MDSAAELNKIIDSKQIVPVYQPIVEMASGNIVGYEALSRGPKGSGLESPIDLFLAAAKEEKISELDWLCRAAALRKAIDMAIYPPFSLFINFHPYSLSKPLSMEYYDTLKKVQSQLHVVAEVTEQSMLHAPAEMLQNLHRMRESGWLIALDDVGAHSSSLALLPFVDPDIIKLDMSLVRESPNQNIADIVGAINAHAEETGAVVLAEGIENEEHMLRAISMGATLGQGWKWGKPAPLPTIGKTTSHLLTSIQAQPYRPAASPFERVSSSFSSRPMSLEVLKATGEMIERMALQAGSSACLLSTFVDPNPWQERMQAYEKIAQSSALTAVFTSEHNQASHSISSKGEIHFVSIPHSDPLQNEHCVVLLSSHQSACLVARPVNNSKHIFEAILTFDRQRTKQAAASLMARMK